MKNKLLTSVFTGFMALSLVVSMPAFALARGNNDDNDGDNHGGRVSEVARLSNSGPGNANDIRDIARDNRGRDHAEDNDNDEDRDEDSGRNRGEGVGNILALSVEARIQLLESLIARLQALLRELAGIRSDSTVPIILAVSAVEIKSTEAKIIWTTNELADSKVFFSATSPVNLSTAMVKSKGGLDLSHRVSLEGLTPSTTYFFVAQSTDAAGNVAHSAEGSFMTLVADSQTQFSLRAILNSANEVPSTTSITVGSGTFVLDTVANTLSFNIVFTGLSSAETGAHIHGPANIGVNAGILFTLPAGNPKIGVWNYPEASEADILAGRTYVNIHSVNFPGGEIRGQIVR